MTTVVQSNILETRLEALYKTVNHRKMVHPDPLEFLYRYESLKDREIAGLIASCLAYGRVAQILKSVAGVLNFMGQSPHNFLLSIDKAGLERCFHGFCHRFACDSDLIGLLESIQWVLREYGSLYACFLSGYQESDDLLIRAQIRFCETLSQEHDLGHLMPLPQRGSACKRLNLFLRWMVRSDAVDPGGWSKIPSSKLIIPLDTHMHRIGNRLGFSTRKQADQRTALEITDAFRELIPDDPVKYDFVLTRMGIRKDVATDLFDSN
ncbi:MAG TPA: TIGR02757 family protein [Desulfatirhabdiaceae bacterium]|nr:TIGR02757 family protein [Desulfatirhabdiaceae bacterium]